MLADHGRRVLEVGDLHHGVDATGREVELLADAALEELDALLLLLVAEGLLVELLVLELVVDVVADGGPSRSAPR